MAKFIVTKRPFGDEVEVKLHPDTKDKIVKIGIWSASAAIALAAFSFTKKDNERIQSTTPQE